MKKEEHKDEKKDEKKEKKKEKRHSKKTKKKEHKKSKSEKSDDDGEQSSFEEDFADADDDDDVQTDAKNLKKEEPDETSIAEGLETLDKTSQKIVSKLNNYSEEIVGKQDVNATKGDSEVKSVTLKRG